jgi:hypothetical protein
MHLAVSDPRAPRFDSTFREAVCVSQIARSSRIDFLSGLVTIDGAMIALVDLPNLLAQGQGEDGADPDAGKAAAPPARGQV